MIKCVSQVIKTLTANLRQEYVIRYTKGKSVFDTTSYNQQWIPRQKPYHKSRKPRQTAWNDQTTVFPKLIPPLYKPCKFKHFVTSVIQKQQKQKAIRSKQYLISDIRAGDIIQLTFQQTFQNPQTVTYRGLVLSFKRRNSYSAAIQMGIKFGGIPIKCIFMIHSPKVKKIQLISKGSGCFESNLKNGWHKMTKSEFTSPKIRKRVMKTRKDEIKRKASEKNIKSSTFKLDQIHTDNVRRLI